jgi:hypothetical protein
VRHRSHHEDFRTRGGPMLTSDRVSIIPYFDRALFSHHIPSSVIMHQSALLEGPARGYQEFSLRPLDDSRSAASLSNYQASKYLSLSPLVVVSLLAQSPVAAYLLLCLTLGPTRMNSKGKGSSSAATQARRVADHGTPRFRYMGGLQRGKLAAARLRKTT